jgi:hypothetical protein
MGQNADLMDLQRILLRSKSKMSDASQQNMTRWAVFTAAGLLRQVHFYKFRVRCKDEKPRVVAYTSMLLQGWITLKALVLS